MNLFDFIMTFGLTGPEGDGQEGESSDAGGSQTGSGDLPVVPQWASNFPGELTGDESSRNFLGRFKGDGAKVEVPVELVKSAIETKRMTGSMVKIPGDNAKPDEINAFNKKIGVPEKPDGYEFKTPDGVPDGLFQQDQIDAFRTDAHQLGIPKKKAEELFSRFAGRQVEAYNAMNNEAQTSLQQRIDTLKKDLGNDYDATIATADKAVNFADPEMVTVFEKAGLLGHPAIVKGFAKIGNAMGEDVLRTADTSVPQAKVTKEEVEGWMKDPKYRLPQGDPVGEQWRKKVQAGFEQLYPGAAGGDVMPSGGRTLHGAR